MKKAWLNEMIAVRTADLHEDDLETAKKSMTVKLRTFGGTAEVEVFKEHDGWLWLPRRFGFSFLRRRGFKFKDGRFAGEDLPLKINWTILDEPPYPHDQSILVKTVVAKAQKNGFGGFAVAPTASGKTLMGAYIGALLGGTTLILVHKSDLIKNWRTSIEKNIRLNGKPPRIGTIRKTRCDYGPQFPFVIGMVQSLAQKNYPPKAFQSFRTVIFDECHHVPAETFLSVAYRFNAKYLIGVTATLRRKDGTERVFTHAIGDVLYAMVRGGVEGRVHFRKVPFLINGSRIMAGGRVSPSMVAKAFANLDYRNDKILADLQGAFKAGRKNLVLAHTKEHLAVIFERLPKIMQRRAGFYIGGRTEQQIDKVAQKKILLGTYGMAYEGMDVPDLDMLTVVTPVRDVEQPAGRVLRKHPDKMKVLILDYVDDHKTLRKWALERRRYYLKEGFKIAADFVG